MKQHNSEETASQTVKYMTKLGEKKRMKVKRMNDKIKL